MTTTKLETTIDETRALFRSRISDRGPGVGLSLGSGLGSFAGNTVGA